MSSSSTAEVRTCRGCCGRSSGRREVRLSLGTASEDLGRIVLPEAGTYAVEVYADGTATGPVRVPGRLRWLTSNAGPARWRDRKPALDHTRRLPGGRHTSQGPPAVP